MVRYTTLSSANNLTDDDADIHSGRSFLKARKSNGPRTVPCGTPEETAVWSDVAPSKIILSGHVLSRNSQSMCGGCHGSHNDGAYLAGGDVGNYQRLVGSNW